MGILKSTFLIANLVFTLTASGAYARGFDPTKLRCIRQDDDHGMVYFSEIKFNRPGTTTSRRILRDQVLMLDWYVDIIGDVMSYRLNGTKKQFISGYSLCSVIYRNNMLSGLTGDPHTRIDGKFRLERMERKNNGKWKFTYIDLSEKKIEAEFSCSYK